MITSTEETFQSFSHENDNVNLDALHYPDRNSETKDVWSNISENTDLVDSREGCEIPEEKSVLLFSGRDADETSATNADKDGSREDKTDYDRVCLTAGESNQGLCTYLNLAPTVETEEQKLNALDELIRKSWEIEALGLVEKAPRISNDQNDPSANWTKAEKEAATKINIKYLPGCKQFQMSISWKDDPPNFRKSNRAAVKHRQDGVTQRLGDKIVHL